MWRGYGRQLFREWRRQRRWDRRGFPGPGPMWGPGYRPGPRRGPCCCAFFALPVFALPLILVGLALFLF